MNYLNKIFIPVNIRRLRKQHNMTQKRLAELLNVTAGTVSKWEVGDNLPLDHLEAIADLFKVSIDELYGKAPLSKPSSPIIPFNHIETLNLPNTEYVYAELVQNNLSCMYEIWLWDLKYGGVKMMVYCNPIEDFTISQVKEEFIKHSFQYLSVFRDVLDDSGLSEVTPKERAFIEGYESFLAEMDELHKRLGIN